MASPKSTLPNDSREDQDSRFEPVHLEKIKHAKIAVGETSNNSGDIQNLEENPDEPVGGLYEPSAGGKKGSGGKQPFTLKGVMRKKGPLALIATILFGGGGILAFLFTPALGLVNFKEMLMGDLNDQLSAYSLRSDAMLRTKIDQRTSGFCSSSIKIRCQFSSMSSKQVERFRKAGFIIEEGDVRKNVFGRERIIRMQTPNGDVINNPQDLRNLSRDPAGRNLMLRAFNPAYMALSDGVANGTFRKLGLSKASWYDPAKGARESARAVVSGERSGKIAAIQTDPDKGQYVVDPESKASPPNNRIYEADDQGRFNQAVADAERVAGPLNDRVNAEVPGKAVSGVLTGAIKGASIVGIADAACTTYNVARTVAAAAKTARALQLAQFSMMYLNTADSIRAGTAEPEEVEFLATKLAEIDTTKEIIDETQTITEEGSPSAVFANLETSPNPNYGKSGYDSAGYAMVARNEAPRLTARELQYTVGGGLNGTFSSVTSDIAATLGGPEGIRDTCGVVQSWWVRGAGLAIGAIAAIGTGGASLIISVGGSIAVAAALPFLEASLIDILKGQVVSEDTDSVDAGNAIVAGGAVINGQIAQARGLKPLTLDGIQEYSTLAQEVKGDYIAAARYEAQAAPFDIMNQYSFLGSFARTLYVPATQMSSSVQGTFTAIPNILATSVSRILPKANALQAEVNIDRFTQCTDAGYEELGIAADVFCNVRYGLSPQELQLDTIEVLDFMLQAGHIDGAGQPKSDAYKEYLQYCVNREDGWGETGQEGTGAEQDKYTGQICMEENATISNFRVYTLDKSIADAMDETEASVALNTFEIVSPVSKDARLTTSFGPRVPPCSGCSSWHQGVDLATSNGAVFSIMDGVVESVGSGGLGNNVVSIRHEDGLVSTYWHMFSNDIIVKAGDTVTAGQQIGLTGNAGQSTGNHLHFEIDISGVENREEYTSRYIISTGGSNPGQRIDPIDFFEKNSVPGFSGGGVVDA